MQDDIEILESVANTLIGYGERTFGDSASRGPPSNASSRRGFHELITAPNPGRSPPQRPVSLGGGGGAATAGGRNDAAAHSTSAAPSGVPHQVTIQGLSIQLPAALAVPEASFAEATGLPPLLLAPPSPGATAGSGSANTSSSAAQPPSAVTVTSPTSSSAELLRTELGLALNHLYTCESLLASMHTRRRREVLRANVESREIDCAKIASEISELKKTLSQIRGGEKAVKKRGTPELKTYREWLQRQISRIREILDTRSTTLEEQSLCCTKNSFAFVPSSRSILLHIWQWVCDWVPLPF